VSLNVCLYVYNIAEDARGKLCMHKDILGLSLNVCLYAYEHKVCLSVCVLIFMNIRCLSVYLLMFMNVRCVFECMSLCLFCPYVYGCAEDAREKVIR
jgi:hypothetical protein